MKTYSGEGMIRSGPSITRDQHLAAAREEALSKWNRYIEETVLENVRSIAKDEGIIPRAWSFSGSQQASERQRRLDETLVEFGICSWPANKERERGAIPRLAHHPECPCSFSESRFACNCPPGWPQ